MIQSLHHSCRCAINTKHCKLLYARYGILLCLCLLDFLCVQVSCEIWKTPGTLPVTETCIDVDLVKKFGS